MTNWELEAFTRLPSRAERSEFFWRRGSESNRRIKVLQTSPLPLGYRALPNINLASQAENVHLLTGGGRSLQLRRCRTNRKFLERETGFEPATSTLARSHSTTELLPLSLNYEIPR